MFWNICWALHISCWQYCSQNRKKGKLKKTTLLAAVIADCNVCFITLMKESNFLWGVGINLAALIAWGVCFCAFRPMVIYDCHALSDFCHLAVG